MRRHPFRRAAAVTGDQEQSAQQPVFLFMPQRAKVTEDHMVDERKDPDRTRSDIPNKTGGGILPDGVRGTTRDVDATRPADEHAGYKDPNKPETRKRM